MSKDTAIATQAFSQLALFQGADMDYLRDVIKKCPTKEFSKGDVLLGPAQTNNSVYCLLEGALSVHLGQPDGEIVAELTPGNCVGEMSIIEDCNPSAYVIATKPSTALAIERDLIWVMIERSHAIARNLLKILSSRVRQDNQKIANANNLLRGYERHVMTDALTGLHNRAWMEEIFERIVQRCHSDGRPACLVMADLDHLKEINTAHGLLAGDHVLYAVAHTLRDHLRATDMLARHGGDEFAILLPDTNLDQGLQIAERARKAIEDYNQSTDEKDGLKITLSFGIAELGNDQQLVPLIERADQALSRAKQLGRSQISN